MSVFKEMDIAKRSRAASNAAKAAYKQGYENGLKEQEAKATSLERELAEAKAQMRTPGTVEVCHRCRLSLPMVFNDVLNICHGMAMADDCPLKRAHSPAAKEAE